MWCTLNNYSHAAYETELGIPQAIAQLEDGIFENLEIKLAMEWPEKFLAAIEPGADLSLVMARWFVWMLVDPTDGVIKYVKSSKAKAAIQCVAELYQRQINGCEVSIEEFRETAAAAAYYPEADPAAAYYPASAYYAYSACYGDSVAVGFQARKKQAEKLIEMLSAAPMALPF